LNNPTENGHKSQKSENLSSRKSSEHFDSDKNKNLIIICGPTAVGKTKNSIDIAKYFQTEIISADARQIFGEINIGTAKPSFAELSEIKHHFIGTISIEDTYNAGIYEQQAIGVVEQLFAQKNYAVVCGGSGLYIKALCEGFDDLPQIHEALRNEILQLYKEEGITSLQNKLKALDLEYYKQIDIQNPRRLMRGIENCISSGKLHSELQKQKVSERNFKIIKIGFEMNRDELYEKINQRVDEMMASGLLKEVESLYLKRNLNALQTVGYSELFDFIDGKYNLDEAILKIKQHTRNYAKRQMTWFKKDDEIKWFHPSEVKEAITYIDSMTHDR